MNEQYFKCTLIDDVVLNASLATEGNMESLDYIPGSNFLGIVANKLYEKPDVDIVKIVHSGDVSYGDALPAINRTSGYAIPFAFFQDKLYDVLETDTVYVHHALPNKSKWEKIPVEIKGNRIQLKQKRAGFLTTDGDYILKPQKTFYLKSAYDRDERRSADSKMFGFEALKKGQEFIFSLRYSDKISEEEKNTIKNILSGNHRIGKSKTAQFGRVKIDPIDKLTTISSEKSKLEKGEQLVVYAASNLCLINEYGQSRLTPEAKDFNLAGKAELNQLDTQIRTHSYSPWNSTRNTTDTQRNVILKGSVIVFDLTDDVSVDDLPESVGEYQSEGLGRVIYNPEFLAADENGVSRFKFEKANQKQEKEIDNSNPIKTTTQLGKLLAAKKEEFNNEKEIGEKIHYILASGKCDAFFDKDLSNSQWGEIRTLATQEKDIDKLINKLFGEDHKITKDNNGYLMHGVAAEKVWDKKGGSRRNKLYDVINANKKLGTLFVAKLAVEIPKYNKQNNNKSK